MLYRVGSDDAGNLSWFGVGSLSWFELGNLSPPELGNRSAGSPNLSWTGDERGNRSLIGELIGNRSLTGETIGRPGVVSSPSGDLAPASKPSGDREPASKPSGDLAGDLALPPTLVSALTTSASPLLVLASALSPRCPSCGRESISLRKRLISSSSARWLIYD